MINNTTNFKGRIATGLCKKLGVALDAKIPGGKDLILTDIKYSFNYNRYKNGINYKIKSYHDFMENNTLGVFYNKNTPEVTSEIKIINTKLDLNDKILNLITPEITAKAEKELEDLHKLDILF